MTLSRREMTLAMATLAVVLFGGSAFLMRPRYRQWTVLRAGQADIRAEIDRDRALVEQRDAWATRLDAVGATLTRHPAEQPMDVYWLSIVDQAARANGISLRRLQAGREIDLGDDLYELSIECREWEGGLDGLIRFLFELQARAGMLDMRYLTVRPIAGAMLRGRFTVACAYKRGAPPGGPAAERGEHDR